MLWRWKSYRYIDCSVFAPNLAQKGAGLAGAMVIQTINNKNNDRSERWLENGGGGSYGNFVKIIYCCVHHHFL